MNHPQFVPNITIKPQTVKHRPQMVALFYVHVSTTDTTQIQAMIQDLSCNLRAQEDTKQD